jgi:DNA primase
LANSATTIDQVLQAVDIVDVIAEVLELQKKGKNFVGLCPFHADSNPSMTVSPEKQIFKCFSCGAGGNALKFVQDYEQIPFASALQKLAQRAGIEVQVQANPHASSFKTNQIVAQYYQFVLHNTKEGEDVLSYLTKRGLHPDTIKLFGLGYAPSQQRLLAAAEKQQTTALDLVKVGLLHDTSNNELFRQRLMIPIDDGDGRIVGFSGRILQGQEAKYINSPDSAIFHKSRLLYNLSRAKLSAKQAKRLFVVEGYMDVYKMVQSGYAETVAVMGTAFTKEHAALLAHLQVPVYFLFDGDTAGKHAALKSSYNATKLDAYVTLLPAGVDPDEFLSTQTSGAMDALIAQSNIAAEFVYQQLLAPTNFDSSASIDTFKRSVISYLRDQSPALQERYFQKLASTLNVSVESLLREIKAPARKRVEPALIVTPAKYIKAERLLLNVMRYSKEQAYVIDQQMDSWIRSEHETLKELLLQYYQTYSTYQAERFFPEVPEALQAEALMIFQEPSYLSKSQIADLFDTIEEYQLKSRLKYLQELRKTATASEKMALANEEFQIQQQLKRGGRDE